MTGNTYHVVLITNYLAKATTLTLWIYLMAVTYLQLSGNNAQWLSIKNTLRHDEPDNLLCYLAWNSKNLATAR